MQRRHFLLTGLAGPTVLFAGTAGAQADSGIVVVGHASMPRIDIVLVQRLYTGRVIEFGGQLATVLNLPGGHALRQRFLAAYLQSDEERYRAYWTVRRHVGKGAPPREVDSVAAMLDAVASTPGALGYVGVGDLRASSNVICRT